jgi:hypothetical protein
VVIVVLPGCRHDLPDGLVAGAAAAFEGFEVVPAHQVAGSLCHGGRIEGAENLPGILAAHGLFDRSVADPVAVKLPAAVEPGVKIKGDPLAGSHRDIPGQQPVHAFL